MTLIQGFLLGILQGIAEFLPISSSGHLEVLKFLFDLEEMPILFDVFLHVATLAAVIIYFRKLIGRLFSILFRLILRKSDYSTSFNVYNVSDTDSKILTLAPTDEIGQKTIFMIIITTFITGILGIITSKLIPALPLKCVAVGFLITAILLIVSAVISKRKHGDFEIEESENKDNIYIVHDKSITWLQAVIIGIAQGIGTLPGISRSGSTIAGACLSGVDRKTAGDYSFIVSIPAVFGAFILSLKDAIDITKDLSVSFFKYFSDTVGILPAIVGFVSAFVFGYIALSFLMKIIHKGKLEWFAVYLIPLGIVGLIFF